MPKKTFTFTSLPAELQAQSFIQAGVPYSRSDLAIRLAQAYPYAITVAIGADGQLLVYRAADIPNVSTIVGTNSTTLAPDSSDKTASYGVSIQGSGAVTAAAPELDAYFVTPVTPKRSATVAAGYLDNVMSDSATFIFSQKNNGLVAASQTSAADIYSATFAANQFSILNASLTPYTGSVGAAAAFGE